MATGCTGNTKDEQFLEAFAI